jgi:hypothetical protein
MMVGLFAILALVVSVQAEDKDKDKEKEKEKTLKGTILCGKCELKKTKECANAIRVKEDGKEVIYYFEDKGRRESYHRTICQNPKEGSVKGTISEKDGKKYIKPAKDGVRFKDKDKDKDKDQHEK